MPNSDTARIYSYADSGVTVDYAEAKAGETTIEAGGFGDANRVFEVPRELWERYVAARDAMLRAEDEIRAIERP